MSADDKPCQATPPVDLRQQIMDSRVPKNEREWWASRTIEELERERDRLRAELVATLSVCSAETYRSEEAEHDCRVLIVELNVAKAELATERARLDWFADYGDTCWHDQTMGVLRGEDSAEFYADSFRAAIDAAMKEGKA